MNHGWFVIGSRGAPQIAQDTMRIDESEGDVENVDEDEDDASLLVDATAAFNLSKFIVKRW